MGSDPRRIRSPKGTITMARHKVESVTLQPALQTYYTIADIVRSSGTSRANIDKMVESGELRPAAQTMTGTLLFSETDVNVGALHQLQIDRVLKIARASGLSRQEFAELLARHNAFSDSENGSAA